MNPKILIISETFKSTTGGGITLSNLFRNYPKDLLANAIDAVFVSEIESDEICDNFYSLGKEERKILPVFSFLHGKHTSGKYKFQPATNKKTSVGGKGNLKSILKKITNPVFNFFGINHVLFHYELSDNLKSWIVDFKPDYIYSQLSSVEMMNFTLDVKHFSGAKLAIHIMDDWASTLGRKGLFGFYWKRVVEKKFREVIGVSEVLMSISDGMAEEYQSRYGHYFIPFHNPIDIEIWQKSKEKTYFKNEEKYVVLYSGRIGTGVEESLIDCAKAISKVSSKGYQIEFQIQTTTQNHYILDQLISFPEVRINPVARYEELPEIFSASDIMIMPFDFNKEGIRFLRLSMPTKASEYMISGSPIILFCDKKLSIWTHASRHKWAKIVDEHSDDKLAEAIIELILDENLRKNLGQFARKFAIESFSRDKIHRQFMNCFK